MGNDSEGTEENELRASYSRQSVRDIRQTKIVIRGHSEDILGKEDILGMATQNLLTNWMEAGDKVKGGIKGDFRVSG